MHGVQVSAFRMDQHPVDPATWDAVVFWSAGHGYGFDHAGAAKGALHPVQHVNWFDCVKWCNARSEMEGLRPVYYVDEEWTQTYKTGQAGPHADWTANGYRLPTEAEWEKAARGGAIGKRFPWRDQDSISHARANYRGYPAGYAFDAGPGGYPAEYAGGGTPYTSPAGELASGRSGYDVHGMAGNVWEWCWDWYDGTWYGKEAASEPDTRGPAGGAYRVVRGGAWSYYAWGCRTAYRFCHPPAYAQNHLGFRTVRAVEP
ncbi:MAG: formylglycine-generating enzyme family protein [Lentisphaerae bacterium]|nr:formylglycine-generating enzyme family protein [Lentisphaerota bacterium]